MFQIIAEEKNLTKASKRLYMTPQGLSKVIKSMEAELDCKLIERTAGGIALTTCGQYLWKHSETITTEYEEIKKELHQIQEKENGVVNLLSSYGILRLVTPECLIAFQEKYPDIEFHYHEYPDRETEWLFQNKKGNIAFSIADFDTDLYDITELETFPIKLLTYEGHPLSRKESVRIEDLKGEPLYIENSDFKIHHMIVERCRNAGFEPNIVFGTSGFSLCHKMVKAKKGISVTVDFVFDDMKEKGLKLIPFSDGNYEWKICMLTRKGEVVNDAVRIFRQHIIEWVELIREGGINR